MFDVIRWINRYRLGRQRPPTCCWHRPLGHDLRNIQILINVNEGDKKTRTHKKTDDIRRPNDKNGYDVVSDYRTQIIKSINKYRYICIKRKCKHIGINAIQIYVRIDNLIQNKPFSLAETDLLEMFETWCGFMFVGVFFAISLHQRNNGLLIWNHKNENSDSICSVNKVNSFE